MSPYLLQNTKNLICAFHSTFFILGQTLSVFEYIAIARREQRKLADSTARNEVVTQFVKFLDEIGTKRDLYPWPLHIDQATRCRDKLTFACLNSQAAE